MANEENIAAGVFELRAEGDQFRADIANTAEVVKRFERVVLESFTKAGKAASDTTTTESASKRYVSAIEREALAVERKTAALVMSAAEMRKAEAAGRGESANAAAAIAKLDAAEAAYKSLSSQMQQMRDINVFGDMLAKSQALGQVGKNIDAITAALDRLEGEALQAGQTRVFEARVAEAAKLGMAEQYIERYKQAGQNMVAAERAFSADTSFIDGLQRRANAINKTQSELLELEAAQRGLTTQAAPHIAALRAQEKALGIYSAGARDARVQTNQMRTALSQLPMQFTDIFTSLAGGQNPLLVLIQQGGQIKDSFGGIGNALRGMAGAIKSAFTPVTAIVVGSVAALGTLGYAFAAGEKEASAYRRSLVLTGNAAGTTAGHLQTTAEAVSRAVGTQGKAADTIAALAATGRVAARDLSLLAEAAIRLEREGGPAVKDTVAAFAELGKAPTQGALKLNETTRFLTVSVLEQIKALEEQGRVLEAARVAQNAYATESIARAKELESQLGSLERAARGVTTFFKEMWDAVLDVGRAESPAKRIEGIAKALEANARRTDRSDSFGPSGVREGGDAQRARLLEELKSANRSILNDMERTGRAAANIVDDAYVKATASVKKWGDESLTAAQRSEKALKDFRREVDTVNTKRRADGLPELDSTYIKKAEQALVDSFAKGNKAIKERDGVLEAARAEAKRWADEIADFQKIGAEATAATEGLTKAEQRLIDALKDPAWVGRTAEQQKLTIAEYLSARAKEELAAATKAAAKAQEEYTKAMVANAAEMAKAEATEETSLQRLRDEYVELTQGKGALEAQTVARLELAAAIREQAAAQALIDGAPDSTLVADSLLRQAKLLRDQIAQTLSNKGARIDNEIAKANEKAAEDAMQEWSKAADDIRGSLTDAFRSAFESGENFGTAMVKVIERELKARVATALSNMLSNEVLGLFAAAAGAVSQEGSSNSSSMGSWISRAKDGSTLYDWGSKAYNWYTGAGSLSTTYGSSATIGGTVAQSSATKAALFGAEGYSGGAAASGGGSSASGAGMASTFAPYAIAAIVYAIAADQMADWSLSFGGRSLATRAGVTNTTAGQPGLQGIDQTFIDDAVAAGFTRIANPQDLTDGLASALFDFGDKFASSVGAKSAIEAAQVLLESDRANPSFGEVKFFGPGGVEIGTTGMQTDLSWNPEVAAPQLITRSAGAFAQAFQSSDAPAWVKASLGTIPAELERITPEITKQFEDPLQQALALNQAMAGMLDGITNTFAQLDKLDEQLGPLGGVFETLVRASNDARHSLVGMFGGIEVFQQQVSGYVDNFYTDAERATLTLGSIGRELGAVGLELPTTRDGFRALADAQDLTTESGRAAFRALMGTADAFASVTEQARSAAEILSERTALERELLQLQGNTVELRARERAQLDESNRALFDQVRALEDRQALQSAIDSNVTKFMTPEQATNYQYSTIARDLQGAGMFGDWADFATTLKDATKDEIYAVASQFLELSNVSADAKIKMVEAAGALADLKDSAGSAADELPQLIAQFTASLRSSDLSPLSFRDQLNVSRGLFDVTLAGAKSGNADARENLIGNAQAYLEEARAFFGSSMEYANVFRRVTTELDAIGAPSADPQVQAIREQVAQIEAMRNSVDGLSSDSSAKADTQIDLARTQIAELQNLVQNQSDTNAALAAGNRALWDQLEALNLRVQQLLVNAQLEATAPS